MSLKFWFITWFWRVYQILNLKDFLFSSFITSLEINKIWSQYFSLILMSSTFFFTDGVADWGIELQELLFFYLTWKQFFLVSYFPHLFEWHTKEKKMLEKDIIWWCIFRRNTFYWHAWVNQKYSKSSFQLSLNFFVTDRIVHHIS